MPYSIIKKIEYMKNVINNPQENLTDNALDTLLDTKLQDNENSINIISSLIDLFKEIKEKEVVIKIPDNFINKFLDVLIKQHKEGCMVDSVNLVNSLGSLMNESGLKLTDTSRGKLLDLFIKNTEKGDKCNLVTLIQKLISLDEYEDKKFSYNDKDEEMFVKLLNIKQDHCNASEWVASLQFFLNEVSKKFSDSNEEMFLEALKNKINKGIAIAHADIMSLNNLKENVKISADFMNKLFYFLIEQVTNESNIMQTALSSLSNMSLCKVMNAEKEVYFLETAITKLLMGKVDNDRITIENLTNDTINNNLKRFLNAALNKKYKIDISEQSLKIFFDSLIKDVSNSFKKDEYLKLTSTPFKQLIKFQVQLYEIIFSLVATTRRSDNTIKISLFSIDVALKLYIVFNGKLDSMIDKNGIVYQNWVEGIYIQSKEEIINNCTKLITLIQSRESAIDLKIYSQIQSSIDQIKTKGESQYSKQLCTFLSNGRINNKEYQNSLQKIAINLHDLIYILNTLQLKSLKDNVPEDCDALCNFLKNLHKNPIGLEGKLLIISRDKPFDDLKFTQYVIKDCQDNILGVFQNECPIQKNNFNYCKVNNNYLEQLLNGRKSFLINSLEMIQDCSDLVKEKDNKAGMNKKNITIYLKAVQGKLDQIKETKKVNSDDISIAASTTESSANLIRPNKNYLLKSITNFFSHNERKSN